MLRCVCYGLAKMTLVEPPDTIGHDFFGLGEVPGVEVIDLRSSGFGDMPDKHLRFTTRNMEADWPEELRGAPSKRARPSHLTYVDADERDRRRSSWAEFRGVCEVPAAARPRGEVMVPLSYEHQVERFAAAWHDAGYPVPRGYSHPEALPPNREQIEYQKVRGSGDGRQATSVVPMLRPRLIGATTTTPATNPAFHPW